MSTPVASFGLRLIGAVALLAVAVTMLSLSPVARGVGSAATPIRFYANVGNPVPGSRYAPNPPLVRPSRLILAEDGSWLVVNLHWSSWGGDVARATGVSSASDCSPNCASGKRTHDPAQLTLLRPRTLLGRTVYSCFQLTIPTSPQADEHDCLQRVGKLYLYSPAAGSPVHLSQFLSPDRKIWCVLDNIPSLHQAWCGVGGNSSSGHQYSGQVNPGGKVIVCRRAASGGSNRVCLQNWNSSAQVLKAGQSDVLYQYRCSSADHAVTCVVTTGPGRGKGFRINAAGVTRVGP